MKINIEIISQKGDKSLLSVKMVINIFIIIDIVLSSLLFLISVVAEDSAPTLSLFLISIAFLYSFRWYIEACYTKITFEEAKVCLRSFIPFFRRNLKYSDIKEITIFEDSQKRIIETADEYFFINGADKSKLELISKEKEIKVIYK